MSDFNPFAALLQVSPEQRVSDIIERVCGITLDKNKKHLVYLNDVAESSASTLLSVEILKYALFERILLANPSEHVEVVNEEICETKVIRYLFNCYRKLCEIELSELRSSIKELIMGHIFIALTESELCDYEQLYDILKSLEAVSCPFLVDVFQQFCIEDEGERESLKSVFTAILELLHTEVKNATIITLPNYVFEILSVYTSHEQLAMILLDYWEPKDPNVGSEYALTLLGSLLCISVLPKFPNDENIYFDDPLKQVNSSNTNDILWTNMNRMSENIHLMILNLLKCSRTTQLRTVTWLGKCLHANVDRGKLWNTQTPNFNVPYMNAVSDGFMLSFVSLLLCLCRPFCINGNSEKILKVDPTYCAVSNEERLARNIHLPDMCQETCLVPVEVDEARLTSPTYNFVTECFYMAHHALDLGFRVASDTLVDLNQEMSKIEEAYQDMLKQAGHLNDVAESIKNQMVAMFSKYLAMKCALCEPNFQNLLFNFISSSAFWLNQVAVNVDFPKNPLHLKVIKFPLPQEASNSLKCIPEFVLENIVCYLIFLKRFNISLFEQQGCERLNPILTFILVYMSSVKYTKNPHLRARLAESMEALLPFHKDEVPLNRMGGLQRERLFMEHQHRDRIVEVLLEVFVGIEMTGQNVQFEQKFNYRRPMYLIMDYIWEIDEYQRHFLALAQDAERNMDGMSPKIFLRFINLLINDAIFLLDEALANMSKLREIQMARDAGEWGRLPLPDQGQNLAYLNHIGMLARYDNILGRDTIHTLEKLTSKITIVFTHNTMVDRVASMLNYFLLNLVGPNQKNFKVKDYKEYHFDPAANVLDICRIYVHLKESDSFCLAVSQDGRSYSPQLFTLAEDVLVRIGGGTLIGELQDLSKKVSQKAAEHESSEIAMSEAPEHFLDPIMSTLMVDPVILPSSKQIVDRTTIARHLLSDQTDPFNRVPLSMDQVIPNTELAAEIRQWMNERNLK
ncbi:hypothetical protein FQA39_LY18394 [Lamprigera yunnana]|nr:hypothetical protein FQA39_LY18394 [Lamprigera yunnana]